MLQPHNRSQKYEHLFAGIDTGHIKIPKFQREFVWNKEQTARLIDSILKGFPIGTFTYWETTEELRHVKNIGNFSLPTVAQGHPVSYVLDGQQRITSLYAVRKGVIYSKEDGEEIDYKDISIDLSFDPESDEQIVSATPRRNGSVAISVFDLLNGSLVDMMNQYSEEQLKKIETYKTRLEGYDFSLVLIGTEYPIDVATEVFTRINTGGTRLNLFEIMVAKTYSDEKNFDLSEKYEHLINGNGTEKCLAVADYNTIPPATILRCVALHLGPETRRRDILRLDKDQFIDSWEEVKKGIFSAVEFLRTRMRIPVSNLLPYDSLLVPLTYFHIRKKKPTKRQVKLLIQYFWWASLSQRFSSAVDTALAADRRRMDAILKERVPDYRGEDVVLDVNALVGRWFSTGDAVCKALLCLYAYFRPQSFETGAPVRIDNGWLQRSDSKNYHHFFPKKYLKDQGCEDWHANSAMNITIVDDYLNKRQIRTRAPSQYMAEFRDSNENIVSTMRTHLIGDLATFGIWDDDYDTYLRCRARKVLSELENRLHPQL